MHFIKERIGKLIDDLGRLIYPESVPVEEIRIMHSTDGREDPAELDPSGWEPFERRNLWGGHREYYWFAFTAEIPEGWDGECAVLEVKTGREGNWDATNPQFSAFIDGRRVQGLDVNHRELILTDRAVPGAAYQVLLAAFTGDQNFRLEMDVSLKRLDRKTEAYYYDLKVPYDTARLLKPDDPAYITIIRELNESLNRLDLREEGSPTYYRSLEDARSYLKEHFYEAACDGEKLPVICCVGHTHIDVAWLWTLPVTRDKAVRSFSTVLELMKRYPEYRFMSSQPQLYAYVKEAAPDVYEQIRERVREGRWEAEGGMWLEADCNLASGEALSRQFLYGKRFFRKEFGKDSEILWLPDVFGYSAALPQIMKLCGIRYFMTTKISWNETNMMPVDTFLWEGIDGTRRLTHFIPTRDYNRAAEENGTETEHFTTYNGFLNPSQMKGAWARYNNKDLNDEVLCSFGYGDGGGGPTRGQLENQRRMAKGIPGLPRTKMTTARAFFEDLDRKTSGSKALPVWRGELYLEYHRGTYTTMARNKKWNRLAEFALQNAETYAVMASHLAGASYPKETLDGEWITLLRNQFHDILPGSAIHEVYEDSKREYFALFQENRDMQAADLQLLADRIGAPAGTLAVFNPNSFEGTGIVSFRMPAGTDACSVWDGNRRLPAQKTEDGWIFCAENVPPKGYRTFRTEEGTPAEDGSSGLDVSESRLENRWFRITLNGKGQMGQVYDKRARRNLFPEEKAGNVIVCYEDRPHNYDAWDINSYYTETSWEVDGVTSVRVTERGPVRATVRIERPFLRSVIVQYVSVYADIPRIDIRNEIDWREHQLMLKDHFPVEVHTNEATFDIQYGNVVRNTTDNTSWDWSKFEVCHHKWLDVAEDDYGLSVLNDCKYGVSVRGTDIGLTMLKSPRYPNPTADKEHHTFTYSLFPHEGTWKTAGTVRQAYALNNPMRAVVKQTEGGTLPDRLSFVRVCTEDGRPAENVVIETVKRAEDSDAVIVRLYECFNRRTRVVLKTAERIRSAEFCNIMEEEAVPADFDGHGAAFTMMPYEIRTIRLETEAKDSD